MSLYFRESFLMGSKKGEAYGTKYLPKIAKYFNKNYDKIIIALKAPNKGVLMYKNINLAFLSTLTLLLANCRPVGSSSDAQQVEVYDGNFANTYDRFFAATRSEDGSYDCWFALDKEQSSSTPVLINEKGILVESYDQDLFDEVSLTAGTQISKKESSTPITLEACSLTVVDKVKESLKNGNKESVQKFNTGSLTTTWYEGTCFNSIMQLLGSESIQPKLLSGNCKKAAPPTFLK